MPLFEFLCKKCNKKFEILILGEENIECPRCGDSAVVRQFSNFVSASSSSTCTTTDFCSASPECACKCSGGCCHN